MAIDPIAASAAYRAASQIAQPGAGGDATAAGVSGSSFGSMLSQALQGATSTIRGGEVAAAQGVTGGSDVVDIVGAVTAAELTLETVVAIRDKVISAYQDIMRMPI